MTETQTTLEIRNLEAAAKTLEQRLARTTKPEALESLNFAVRLVYGRLEALQGPSVDPVVVAEPEPAKPVTKVKFRKTRRGARGRKTSGYEIRKSRNKMGAFWLVVFDRQLGSGEFQQVLDLAKDAGGWYSRKWKQVPGGFGFADETTASKWAVSVDPSGLEVK